MKDGGLVHVRYARPISDPEEGSFILVETSVHIRTTRGCSREVDSIQPKHKCNVAVTLDERSPVELN
jgi:hypothetical protein